MLKSFVPPLCSKETVVTGAGCVILPAKRGVQGGVPAAAKMGTFPFSSCENGKCPILALS